MSNSAFLALDLILLAPNSWWTSHANTVGSPQDHCKHTDHVYVVHLASETSVADLYSYLLTCVFFCTLSVILQIYQCSNKYNINISTVMQNQPSSRRSWYIHLRYVVNSEMSTVEHIPSLTCSSHTPPINYTMQTITNAWKHEVNTLLKYSEIVNRQIPHLILEWSSGVYMWMRLQMSINTCFILTSPVGLGFCKVQTKRLTLDICHIVRKSNSDLLCTACFTVVPFVRLTAHYQTAPIKHQMRPCQACFMPF